MVNRMTKETKQLEVKGMYCAACVTRIERIVSKVDGVDQVAVNLATETGRVTFDKNKVNIAAIIDRIDQLGFEATEAAAKRDKSTRTDKSDLKKHFFISAILTVPLAWAMLSHFQWATFLYVPPILTNPFFQFIIAFPIQFIIGFQFYDRAWKAVKNRSANMDVLVVLSTSAAFFYSHYVTFTTPNFLRATESAPLFYETSAFIITFILLGRLLEAKTKTRTTEALEKLYRVQTKTAMKYEGGKEVSISVDQLVPGDVVVVRPGEKVPIDCQVIEGSSMVDEALLTGESIPVEKSIGSNAYAGTINQHGLLKAKVTKKEADTALSNIIAIVEEAQSSKAPIQHIADKITGIFVPIVIMIAVVTFLAWYFVFDPANFNGALGKVIAVLIIACPCALGLATPTSIMVGSGRAAQHGILFKEGKFLELLGKGDYIALDKTGTVTKGVPQITDIYVDAFDDKKFLRLIGAVEQTSDHPIARAISDRASSQNVALPEAKQVENVPGYGIKAVVENHQVIIANLSYYHMNAIKLPKKALDLEERLRKDGKTVMMVRIDNRFAGIVAVFDEVKQSSVKAIVRLKQLGFPIALLSGDHRKAGLAVARKVGIEKVYTECTPNDKAQVVEDLKKQGYHPIMVGDGINDAPALVVSHVGVAIGTGSDIAIESGDVTIIKGDLNRLADAIRISKKTMTNIKQNFVWAFLYNVVMIPFAMFGILVPWLAGAAMAFSSISVVLNSLRLKRVSI